MDLVQPHPTPPTNVDYVYFTVPIMAYIMKGGEKINGALSRSLKKWGHWTSVETPPPLWIQTIKMFY